MSTIQSPRVSYSSFPEYSAPSVPTDIAMSSTGGKPGGPTLTDDRSKWLNPDEGEQERSPWARLATVGLVIYILYRLLS